MPTYKGQGVVVTGGATGIGYAIAEKFLQLGCNVCISDVRSVALGDAVEKLYKKYTAGGQRVLSVVSDVTDMHSMKVLAETSMRELGRIDHVFLNAGVVDVGSQYQNIKAWKWVMDVNVTGVVHGLHHFVPLLINQIKHGHSNPVNIVTTASIASFLTPFLGTYSVSKFAVCAVMEALHIEVQKMGPEISDKLKIHTLHPPFTGTNLVLSSEETRPDGIGVPDRENNDFIHGACQDGITVEEIADAVVEGLERGHFYIHGDVSASEACLTLRVEDIIKRRSIRMDQLEDPRVQPANTPPAKL